MSLLIATLLTATLLTIATNAPAQEPGPGPKTGERLVSQIEFVFRGAARPAWSQQGDWVAYDRRGSDGYSDLYIARPDNAFDRCLTCDLNQFNRQHAGNATWHPSGRFLVFQTETPFKEGGEPYPFLAIPGRNRGSGIWVISPEGKDLFQLVGQREGAFPAHGPRVSFEGGQLAWSERVASSGTWGDWVIRVGELTSGRAPRLRSVRTFEPAAQKAFYEISSFTPDDRGLLFAGNLIKHPCVT